MISAGFWVPVMGMPVCLEILAVRRATAASSLLSEWADRRTEKLESMVSLPFARDICAGSGIRAGAANPLAQAKACATKAKVAQALACVFLTLSRKYFIQLRHRR